MSTGDLMTPYNIINLDKTQSVPMDEKQRKHLSGSFRWAEKEAT